MKKQNDKLKRSDFKKLLPYLKPYRLQIILGVTLATILSIANGATAWVVKPLLDDVFVKKDVQLLGWMPYILIAIFLVKGLTRFSQSYLMRSMGQKIVTRIRSELYAHLLKLPLGFYKKFHAAVLMSRMTNDINLLSDISSQVVSKFFQHFLTLVVLVGVIFYQEWRLALLYCLVLPIMVIPLNIIGKRLRGISHESQTRLGVLNTLLQETFYGLKVIKALAIEKFARENFDDENNRLLEVQQQGIAMEELFTPIMEIVGALGGALVVFFGGLMVIEGRSTPGQFFSFMTAVGMLYNPLRKLSKMHGVLQKSLAAADRVWGLLDYETEFAGQTDLIDFEGLKESVVFKDVCFSVDGKKNILENISLRIEAGKCVSILGFSGSGKHALADLLSRLYTINKGEILLDGVALDRYTIESLRRRIGIVSSSTILFNDTIRNNITLGQAEVAANQVEEAARKANLRDFITSLPDGYETVLGEGGIKLSRINKQLLTVARIFYNNPDVVVVNEIEHAAHLKTDSLIENILFELMRNRTAIIITTKFSIARKCGQIVVIDKGKVLQQGTHEELMAQEGLYKRLSGRDTFDRRGSFRK